MLLFLVILPFIVKIVVLVAFVVALAFVHAMHLEKIMVAHVTPHLPCIKRKKYIKEIPYGPLLNGRIL